MLTMPFGRYKNTPITDLPTDYLRWLADLPDLREPLASEVEAEVHRRRELPEAAEPVQVDDAERWVEPTPGECWQITVRAEGAGPTLAQRVKRFLKSALRGYGLRCTDIRPTK